MLSAVCTQDFVEMTTWIYFLLTVFVFTHNKHQPSYYKQTFINTDLSLVLGFGLQFRWTQLKITKFYFKMQNMDDFKKGRAETMFNISTQNYIYLKENVGESIKSIMI